MGAMLLSGQDEGMWQWCTQLCRTLRDQSENSPSKPLSPGDWAGQTLAPQPFSDIPQHPCTLEMFVLGLVFQRVGREQMLLSNLEGFVRMQIET